MSGSSAKIVPSVGAPIFAAPRFDAPASAADDSAIRGIWVPRTNQSSRDGSTWS